jgi:putative transcriptional regulator
LSGDEIRFLRHEMLMSQRTLSNLLGVSEQEIRRWENGKIKIPKPSESLLRLLYREHADDKSGKIAKILKKVSELEEELIEIVFKDTKNGWQAAA